MDCIESLRKRKRLFDLHFFPSRRGFWITIVCFFALYYILPYIVEWIYFPKIQKEDPLSRCIDDKLRSFFYEVNECNANIRYTSDDESYLPFTGNGYFGLAIYPQSSIYIKSSRLLSLPIGWHPVVTASSNVRSQEIAVTHLVTGIVHRYHCFENGLLVSYYYHAHRTVPNFFSQEIKITNPQDDVLDVYFSNQTATIPLTLQHTRFRLGRSSDEYILITGKLQDENLRQGKVHAICILSKTIQKSVQLKPHETMTFHLPTVMYSLIIVETDYLKIQDSIKNKCSQILNQINRKEPAALREDHIQVWNQLWHSGFEMSHSKASEAMNGDKVNATMYYVLSHTRSYIHEANEEGINKNDIISLLHSPQGCYGGYQHSLQAVKLWSSLQTMRDVHKVVFSWLLTLEKQGCHKLTDAGAEGVMQAMLLSFGGFKFSPHHLEFTIHPKFLHRDYLFRRISYGMNTYINVSVTVQSNNKALLAVSIEGNNRSYYACDGGCIDEPVILGYEPKNFSVKQTEPITAILFISPDHKHIEDVKHTLHVKEVVEAPAHERHVIAMHKHGHHLGGLPKLFWALVCSLIIIFHLFLFKVIYNEYCEKQDRPRPKYTKF